MNPLFSRRSSSRRRRWMRKNLSFDSLLYHHFDLPAIYMRRKNKSRTLHGQGRGRRIRAAKERRATK